MKSIVVLLSFFILVFAFAFAFNPHFPQLILAGESSVATWMSGVLLIMSGSLSLVIGMRKGNGLWYLITAFFFLLAADERFMFHEQFKERIIFSFQPVKASVLVYELPVIAGACLGAVMARLLWRQLRGISRVCLVCAVILGTSSVVIDICTAGVLWEESFKLLAELLVTCALLKRTEEQFHR